MKRSKPCQKLCKKVTTECGALIADFSIFEIEGLVESKSSTKCHGRKKLLKHLVTKKQINVMNSNRSNYKKSNSAPSHRSGAGTFTKTYTKW